MTRNGEMQRGLMDRSISYPKRMDNVLCILEVWPIKIGVA